MSLGVTGNQHKVSRFDRWIRIASRHAADWTKGVVATGGLILVLLLQIPWLEGPMKSIGFSDRDGTEQVVILAVLVSIFFELRGIGERVDRQTVEQRHFADPMDVYPVLQERMSLIRDQNEKILDVLGISLYTAWPTIGFWLHRPELNGWTVRLTAPVSSNKLLSALVPAVWLQEARVNLRHAHATSQLAETSSRGITIETYGYDFMPVVHGFRLGNGDLFFSILSWQDDGRIGRDGYSYEFVPCEDRSASAMALRGIFESWFTRASRAPWPDQPRP